MTRKNMTRGRLCEVYLKEGIKGVRRMMEYYPDSSGPLKKLVEGLTEGSPQHDELSALHLELFPDTVFVSGTYDLATHVTVKDILGENEDSGEPAMIPESWEMTQAKVSQMFGIFGVKEERKVRLTERGPGSNLYLRSTVEAVIEAIKPFRPAIETAEDRFEAATVSDDAPEVPETAEVEVTQPQAEA